MLIIQKFQKIRKTIDLEFQFIVFENLNFQVEACPFGKNKYTCIPNFYKQNSKKIKVKNSSLMKN